ncbi:MAG: acyl-CoA dehydrogenase family protein [Deltaproteobacteria bacterium]|nr:acyl-CoA dehydrogenase family protein [Deltaproteobacteria bacterium]
MSFYQTPPVLENQFTTDRLLRTYLQRTLGDALASVTPELDALGALTAGEMWQRARAERDDEPSLAQWDAWGHRVDHIELSHSWKHAKRIACEFGLVGTAYERKLGALSRVLQFAKVYLFEPSSDTYSCPLAMTDGAAKTLLTHENRALIDRAVSRLTSRRAEDAWTSGQWMTERTGGSDVSKTETVARLVDGEYRLYGTKWFTSATTSEMTLTLARPEGQPEGSRGLSLFYLERARADGSANGITVNRLKDKLGTRKLPTAELLLDGAIAVPVKGIGDGVRNIAPMLNVTRLWNSVCAAAGMRRGIALSRDYARRRLAFGMPLSQKPLHLDTLAGMQAELEAGFMLAFRVAELLGADEAGQNAQPELARLVTPLAKLTTGKQVVAVASEALECFGGAGYVEDCGVSRLLRDAQVLPIWEGTTNVLSLDTLRVLAGGAGHAALLEDTARLMKETKDKELAAVASSGHEAIGRTVAKAGELAGRDPVAVEQAARRVAMTLGRSYALVLLCHHADWCLRTLGDRRSRAAALRFAAHGFDLMSRPEVAVREDEAAMAME